MQVTLELPDELVDQLGVERDRLGEIIERGLRETNCDSVGLRREVIQFLASGPRPEEIVRFRPSESLTLRASDLLQRHRANQLTPSEVSELDEVGNLDLLVSQIKAEARRFVRERA